METRLKRKIDPESAAAIARAEQRQAQVLRPKRYVMVPCHGWNPRTGRRVGSRHRWDGITCKWCGKFKDMVRVVVKTD